MIKASLVRSYDGEGKWDPSDPQEYGIKLERETGISDSGGGEEKGEGNKKRVMRVGVERRIRGRHLCRLEGVTW